MTEKEKVDYINKHGFEKFISVEAREDNKNWLCPSCKKPVIITGEREYETLVEHVSNPNMENFPLRDAYQCSDEKCITRKSDVFWDYYGDMYGLIKVNNETVWGDTDEFFINGNNAPFGSHTRKANVEIYKKGLKKSLSLHPIFCLWIYKPFIEYNYVGNTDGEIIKRTYKLKLLAKNESGEYIYMRNPFWVTWSFLNWDKGKYISSYKRENNLDVLKKAFSDRYYNRSFIYKLHYYYMKLRYWKLYKLLK